MATDLIAQAEGKAVAPTRTPEGALALRLIASSAAWRIEGGADIEQALSPAVRAALPVAQQEAAAMLAPATKGDFKRHVAASLSLVAPAGMSEGDANAWLAVAAETLRGIPADLLAMGCKAARETADHPAKIVPAVMASVKRYWDRRRQDLSRLDNLAAIARGDRVRLPWEAKPFDAASRCSPEDAAAIVAEIGLDLSAGRDRQPAPAPGPRRMPTDADYLAMGVTPAALAEHRRRLAEERAASPSPPQAETSPHPVGPVVAEGGNCPTCGVAGVVAYNDTLMCDEPSCLATWRPDADFVAADPDLENRAA